MDPAPRRPLPAPRSLEPASRLAAVERETAAFAAALRLATGTRAGLDTPVPSCPGWDVRALVHHLGEVHRWVVVAIREGHGRHQEPYRQPDNRLVSWIEEGAAALLTALDRNPSSEAWTFSPPHTVGFWQRRQAQENLVHRWDIENALGDPKEIDASLAADGIGEVIDVFIPRRLRKGWLDPLPWSVRLVDAEGNADWVIGPGDPVATVTGAAPALLLGLWKRRAMEGQALTWSGDTERGRHLLAMPLTA